MVDNVTTWQLITRADAKHIEQYLQDGQARPNRAGVVIVHGHIGNIGIDISPNMIKTHGSIARFLYGTNLCELDIKGIGEAIAKLSDMLHYDMGVSHVSQMEIGKIIAGLTHRPFEYLARFGALPRFQRQPTEYNNNTSVYYKNGSKELKAYDKIAEAQTKHWKIPDNLKGKNALKIELRLINHINLQMKCGRVTMQDLSTPIFYNHMKMKLKDTYNSIHKISNMTIETKELTARKAVYALCVMALKECGQDKIAQFNAHLQQQNAFTTKAEKSRYERNIAKLMGYKGEPDAIITELNNAVETALK